MGVIRIMRMLMILCFGMAVILMSSCTSQVVSLAYPKITTLYLEEQLGDIIASVTAEKGLSYLAFLEMLELNCFTFEEIGKSNPADCFLAVGARHLSIGSGQLTIYEFDSNEQMKKASAFISRDGFAIERPNPYQEGYLITTLISWVNDPYWFMNDSIIVLYVGDDKDIVNFLMENLTFFAGHNYSHHLSDLPIPFMRGFFGTSGTVASIELYDDTFMSVLIDYVFEYLTLEEGLFIEPGTQVQVEFFVDQNTLLLMYSELKVGIEVTVLEFLAEPGEAPTERTAFLILCRDYVWVHVGRFDENLMSHCGNFSLLVLDDAKVMLQDGTAFEGELTNRLLAVYVAMSASPAYGEPLIHGIGTNKVIVINEPGLHYSDGLYDAITIPGESPRLYLNFNSENLPKQQIRSLRLSNHWGLIFSASSFHPLAVSSLEGMLPGISDEITIHLNGSDGTIELQFSIPRPPDVLYVRRWPTELADGYTRDTHHFYELVEVIDNIIQVVDDGRDYIYLIDATWIRTENWLNYPMRITYWQSYTFRTRSMR